MVDVDENTCKEINEILVKTKLGDARWYSYTYYHGGKDKNKNSCTIVFNNVSNLSLYVEDSPNFDGMGISKSNIDSFYSWGSNVSDLDFLSSTIDRLDLQGTTVKHYYKGVDSVVEHEHKGV